MRIFDQSADFYESAERFIVFFWLDISMCCFVYFSRNKKKKIPLMNGEEVDMDLSAME